MLLSYFEPTKLEVLSWGRNYKNNKFCNFNKGHAEAELLLKYHNMQFELNVDAEGKVSTEFISVSV